MEIVLRNAILTYSSVVQKRHSCQGFRCLMSESQLRSAVLSVVRKTSVSAGIDAANLRKHVGILASKDARRILFNLEDLCRVLIQGQLVAVIPARVRLLFIDQSVAGTDADASAVVGCKAQ